MLKMEMWHSCVCLYSGTVPEPGLRSEALKGWWINGDQISCCYLLSCRFRSKVQEFACNIRAVATIKLNLISLTFNRTVTMSNITCMCATASRRIKQRDLMCVELDQKWQTVPLLHPPFHHHPFSFFTLHAACVTWLYLNYFPCTWAAFVGFEDNTCSSLLTLHCSLWMWTERKKEKKWI